MSGLECFCPGSEGGAGSWGVHVCVGVGVWADKLQPWPWEGHGLPHTGGGGKSLVSYKLEVSTVLNLLENGGKGSPNPLSRGRNLMSAGPPIRADWEKQTRVINVQCLLLTQPNTLCRHSGSLFYRNFDSQMQWRNYLCGRYWKTHKIFSRWNVIK